MHGTPILWNFSDAPTTSQTRDSSYHDSNTIIDHRIYPASKTMLLAHVTEFPRTLLKVQRYTLLELGLNIMDAYDYQINAVNESLPIWKLN